MYFASQQIGPQRFRTPEGFLLCKDAPIARTGEQIYTCLQVPTIRPRADGMIVAHRDPEEVFSPITIASFEGKDVTDKHPNTLVTAETWGLVTKGHMQNVRRGEGAHADMLVADLLVKDPDLIRRIDSGEVRELSCGYNADYIEVSPGIAKQVNIRGNHVALVDRGRAGPSIAIQDEETTMTTPAQPVAAAPTVAIPSTASKLLKGVLRAFRTNDADTVAEAVEDADEMISKLQKDNADLTTQLAAKDSEIEELKKKVEDSMPGIPIVPGPNASAAQGVLMTGDAMAQLLAKAEIVAPGVKLATADAAKPGNGEALMRAAIKQAATTNGTVKLLTDGRDLATMDSSALGVLFEATHQIVSGANGDKLKLSSGVYDAAKATAASAAVVTGMNAKAQAGWKSRGKQAA